MENLHNARSSVENANRANEYAAKRWHAAHSLNSNYDNYDDVWNMAIFMK